MARASTAAAAKKSGLALKIVEVAKGNAKTALASLEAGKGAAVHMIAPSKLRIIPGFNVRVHETQSYRRELAELVDSITREGFYPTKPLTGYVGKEGEEDVIFITDGHRRLEATRVAVENGAEITSIPVILRSSDTNMIDLNVGLVKENTGRRLTFLENAVVVKRLVTAGLSEEEISERLGFSSRGVADFLILIAAPKSVRRAVMDDKISGSEAVRICSKFSDDPKKAEATIAEMIAKAEQRGAKKATRKDSGDAPIRARKKDDDEESSDEPPATPTSKVRMASIETKWAVASGQMFELTEIRHFKNLIGDNDWFMPAEDRPGLAVAIEDLEFRALIRRPKRDEAPPVKEAADETVDEVDEPEEEDEPDQGDL